MCSQHVVNKALSRGIIGKSAPILAEITIRKSQDIGITSRRSAVTFLFGDPLPVIADNSGVFLDILCCEESVARNAGGTYPYKHFHRVLIGESSPFSLPSHFPDRR